MKNKIRLTENKAVVENGKVRFLLNEDAQETGYVSIEEGIRMAIEIAEGILERPKNYKCKYYGKEESSNIE